MADNNDRQFSMKFELPRATTRGLRGKQSVRATFRLTKECIDAIQIVAAHLGIKQKSLFDHLIEDEAALRFIADKLGNTDFDTKDSVQKTFVISRNTLDILDEISEKNNASRNAIIEYSVQRLLPIITQEREKHQNRKKMLEHVKQHFSDGMDLLNQTGKTIGADDLMYENLESVIVTYKQRLDEMSLFVEKGRQIEKFKENDMGNP